MRKESSLQLLFLQFKLVWQGLKLEKEIIPFGKNFQMNRFQGSRRDWWLRARWQQSPFARGERQDDFAFFEEVHHLPNHRAGLQQGGDRTGIKHNRGNNYGGWYTQYLFRIFNVFSCHNGWLFILVCFILFFHEIPLLEKW